MRNPSMAGARSTLRHVPNALSIARILSAPVLAVLAARGLEAAFTWVLVPALLSDIVDGLIARVFDLCSTRSPTRCCCSRPATASGFSIPVSLPIMP
jgi:phosphatidylglycerophosphate synthase